MVITVWKNAGYYMLFFLAGLQAVPEDVMEAAHLDGAGLAAAALHHPAGAHAHLPVRHGDRHAQRGDAGRPRLRHDQGRPVNSTNLVLFYIYQQAHENFDIGKASAATLLTVAALLALTALSFRTMANREGGA